MKRTQKLILLMAILVMAIGGLNAARYELRFSLNFTEQYPADMYDTMMRIYPLGNWSSFEAVELPYTRYVDTDPNEPNWTGLYGNYQADDNGLNDLLPLCLQGRWVPDENSPENANMRVDDNYLNAVVWQEDNGVHYQDIIFYWVPNDNHFLLNISAYRVVEGGENEQLEVWVEGPNERASGTTKYSVETDEGYICQELFGEYTIADPENPCEYWVNNSVIIDQYSDWKLVDPGVDKTGRASYAWTLDLEFELRTYEDGNWIISAVDCATGAPIAGASVWHDPDCEGEEEPWVAGFTDENGKFIFSPDLSKSGGFNDPPVGETYYPGPGCYYLTHPSYIAWDPDYIYRSEVYMPQACSFTPFCGTRGVPVELSSFTAAISAMNNVALTWVTQTETGMRGYYIHRAEANELASAQIVSPLILSQNSSQQQSYYYEDAELMDSGTYYYWLEASDLDGSSSYHGPVSVLFNAGGDNPSPGIPLVTQLHSVYPNPFNPIAFIPFSLAKDSAVDIKIYNSRGQLVKQFDLGAKSAGMHRISWDGSDYNGKILSNGVYHIVMNAGKDSYQTKAVLLK